MRSSILNEAGQKNFIEEGQILYTAKELISFLICPICKGLVQRPILACTNCAIYGCGSCILMWEKYGKQRCLSGCEGIKYEKIKNPLLYAVLDGISIRCQNVRNEREEDRCKHICSYSDYNRHIETCPFSMVSCQYCSERMLSSKLNAHLEANHPVLTKIFFIYLDSSCSPLQFNISMGWETTMHQILDILKVRVKVDPENLELVTIKDNRIQNYISKTQTLRQVRSKDGYLFAFQKFPQDQLLPSLSDGKKVIHLEVSILSGFLRLHDQKDGISLPKELKQDKKEPDSQSPKCINEKVVQDVSPFHESCIYESYTRIFHFLDQERDFASIHLMVYRYIRNYLRTYILKKKAVDQVPYLLENIDLENDSDENIHREYTFFLNLKEETDIEYSRPYSLVLLRNLQSQFPFHSNVHFSSYYKLDEKGETQFELAIALAPYLDVKELKLNRCLESINFITSNFSSKSHQSSHQSSHNDSL